MMIMIAPSSLAGSTLAVNPMADPPDRASSRSTAAIYDAELVRRFNAGEEEAFVEIVTRYRGKMYTLALRYLRDRSDAEEIAQDTFVRAYRALAHFRGEASLSSWLHRIAVNLSCNRHWYCFRRHRHNTMSLDYVADDGRSLTLVERFASSNPDPANDAATAEFSQLIDACMGELSEPQRKILTLRSELNSSYRHIADAMGIKIGTVKSRLARARNQLRQLLAETCGEFAAGATIPG
ncbi:MAG TPA: sigma-70 family RNA polymerase sigma factor [Candidatus Didemnitutus sp.]|nr:sigma-70 family RNA polymerase sigma factor [Candidatus Didemnitutus sp.]